MTTGTAGATDADEEVWIQIDTGAQVLKVWRGGQLLRTYEDIAIGRFGTSADKRRKDGKTPLGEYRISRINNESPFRRFFGFNYPRTDQAERALKSGELDAATFLEIRNAHRNHRAPPQDTALGGYIGIHGIGAGDPEVHTSFNWTNGCVAVTNDEVDELAQWVKLGTRVIIY